MMAIKYYYNPKKKQTIAILQGTEFDCINKIEKTMHNFDWVMYGQKYIMPNVFRASVTLAEGDTFNEELGKKYAKEKLMAKYYKSLDSRWDAFVNDIIELNGRIFEIPPVTP